MAKEATKKSPSKLNKAEALAELAELEKSVDFGTTFNEDTELADLRKAVAEGRDAIESDSEEAEETPEEEVAEDEESEDAEEAGDEPADDTDEADEEEVPDTVADAGSVDIVKGTDPYMRYIRTFSKKVHGADYKKLAAEFATKHGGEVVPSTKVQGVKVRWEEKDEETGVLTAKVRIFRGSSHAVKNDALTESSLHLGQVTVLTERELAKGND